jgi:integrase/recombinase XerD
MVEMFDRFMNFKNSEGLAPRTIEEYGQHFQWLCDYLDKDLSKEEMTTPVFLGWIDYMVHDKQLKPMTVNIRVRTMRAFLRYCFMENMIDEPIHERFKPVKVAEEQIEALTVSEIKSLLNSFDESTYAGFRDKVMVMVLLDTMVRISELLAMKRSNIDFKAGTIKLEAMNTKTRKAREVPLSTKTMKHLKEYMIESEDFGEEFNTWRTRLHEVAELSGVKKAVRPHILRHTGALLYIQNGGDPFSLQKFYAASYFEQRKRVFN